MYLLQEETDKLNILKGVLCSAIMENFKYICTNIRLDREVYVCEVGLAWNIGNKVLGYKTYIPPYALKEGLGNDFLMLCESEKEKMIYEISKTIIEEVNKSEL